MADETVMEVGQELETPETPVDDGIQPGETQEETPEEQPELEPPPGTKDLRAVENGKLSPAAKAQIDEIKAKDPALARQIMSALFMAERIGKALPNGLKEVSEMRQTIERLGGPEGVQQVQQELAGWNDLDQKYTTADPRFIEELTNTPETQASFVKLAPSMIEKYRDLHPEGFSQWFANAFVADMYQHRVPLEMERLQDLVADNPKAAEVLGRLTAYFNRIGQWSQKKVELPKSASSGDDRDQKLNEREQNLNRQEWRRESDSSRLQFFQAEWDKSLGGRKLTDVQAAAVKELYAARLHSTVSKIPGFSETLERYFANNDRAGYLRFLSSTYKAHIPKVLRASIDAVVPGKPGPKPGTAPPAGAPPAKPGQVAAGFSWAAVRPDPLQIDYRDGRTTPDMIQAGKAILKDGKRVQWRK